MREVTAQIAGTATYYTQRGSVNDPLCVIVHGWGGSSESWMDVADGLAQRGFNVVVPDVPGFRNSPPPTTAWDVAGYAAWLGAFVEHLHPQGAWYLMGHSFGGRVSIVYTSQGKQLPAKLILMGAAGIRNPKGVGGAATSTARSFLKLPIIRMFAQPVRKAYYKLVVGTTEYVHTTGVMREIFQKVTAQDLTPQLAQINVPTLLLWGELDDKTPLADGKAMARHIPNSRLDVLPQLGHSPHRTHSDLVVSRLTPFLTP